MSQALLVALNAAATRWAARPIIVRPEIPTPPPDMDQSGPITLSSNGQVVSNKIIFADTNAIVGTGLSDIVIEDCLIYHNRSRSSSEARGIKLTNCVRPIIRRCEIINAGAPDRGPLLSVSQANVYVEGGSDLAVTDVTTRRGSTGIQMAGLNNSTIVNLENHDARGPYPRGQAIQWNTCTGTHNATNISDESIPGTSWNEDSFNVYKTPNVHINGVFIPMQSDGLSGRGFVLEIESTTNCLIENAELLYTFNGAGGGFQVGLGNVYDNIKVKGYNRYSVRALPGSSNQGNTLPALCVTAFNPLPVTHTTVDFIYYGIPARAPNGTAYNTGKLNSWYNPSVSGVPQGAGTVTEQDWSVSRSPVRNSFAWRPSAAPSYDLPPRIGSYWLDGRIGTTIIPGTSILGLLPGRYANDPTSRTFQWRKGGVNISGATGIDYDVAVGDSGSNIDCVETVTNASGSYSLTTDVVAIP